MKKACGKSLKTEGVFRSQVKKVWRTGKTEGIPSKDELSKAPFLTRHLPGETSRLLSNCRSEPRRLWPAFWSFRGAPTLFPTFSHYCSEQAFRTRYPGPFGGQAACERPCLLSALRRPVSSVTPPLEPPNHAPLQHLLPHGAFFPARQVPRAPSPNVRSLAGKSHGSVPFHKDSLDPCHGRRGPRCRDSRPLLLRIVPPSDQGRPDGK